MFESQLIECLERVAELLPPSVIQIVIEILCLANQQTEEQLSYHLVQKLPNQSLRRCVLELLETWQQHQPILPPQAIALALETAYNTRQTLQKQYEVQPVWTIPQANGQWIRQTEQVMLEMIGQSESELVLFSFAVYHIPQIIQAVIMALERQVKITVIVELPETKKISFGIFQSLPSQLLEHLTIFYWPLTARPQNAQGRYGSLHMKGIISDRDRVFITSANLTDYALNLNLELGLMTQQPKLADEIYRQLEILIQQNILLLYDPESNEK